MRRRWLPAIGLAAGLGGCSVSMQAIPATHGHGTRYHIQTVASTGTEATRFLPATTASAVAPAHATVIDLPALYRTVLSVPRLADTLSRDLLLCASAVGIVGLINLTAMMRLPKTIRKVVDESSARASHVSERPAPAVEEIPALAPAPALEAAPALALPAVPAPAKARTIRVTRAPKRQAPKPVSLAISNADCERTCACGAFISERSRSGLCRRCAQAARADRGPRLPRPEPAPMLHAAALEGDDEQWVTVATAVISHSRLGERREYYTLGSRPIAEPTEPVFIDPYAATGAEPSDFEVVTYEHEHERSVAG